MFLKIYIFVVFIVKLEDKKLFVILSIFLYFEGRLRMCSLKIKIIIIFWVKVWGNVIYINENVLVIDIDLFVLYF